MESLKQLYATHTGKVSTKWESYLHIYDKLFHSLRQEPLSMLEVGIQNGGSLEIWARYFANAKLIVGCDINPKCAGLTFADNRIKTIVEDINSNTAFKRVTSHASQYDIIIDDGSHLSRDIISTFINYFPLVKAGGLYVVEDMHCAFWTHWGGGVLNQNAAGNFFKLILDLINAEHFKDDLSVQNIFQTFFTKKSFPQFLAHKQIASLQVYDSVVIIQKASPELPNGLGDEVIVGNDAAVEPKVLEARKR